uniref:Uncharacterized protein n=1 Tax=Panagrolaimus sp. ES5 TaxID=591445 RepID=A0AC34FA10_9BILA
MAMPAFGSGGVGVGSTLPPPFGIPSNFQGMPQNNNGMNGMMQQQQSGQYPQVNPQMNPPMNGMMISNQGPQMGQLGGFTNGFAEMIGMSPSPMKGFPGGAMGQQMNNGGAGQQQPFGPAGIPIVGNVQSGNMQSPNQPQQPFGSFNANLGGNSMQQPGAGMNSPLQG